jgi:hypothetical protein
MEAKYTSTLCENQDLSKKIKEKDRNAEFLEKEIVRQGREFTELTQTFEEFLSSRLKQHKRDRISKLKTIQAKEESGTSKLQLGVGSKPHFMNAEVPENTVTYFNLESICSKFQSRQRANWRPGTRVGVSYANLGI